jgi:hypothetical protein
VDPSDDEVELLESTYSSRSNRAVVVLLIVVVAAVVGVLSRTVHSSPPGQHRAALASPSVPSGLPVGHPSGPAASPAPQPLWVFFEPLDDCMSTDHSRRLHVALTVSNLSDQPVRLISATAVDSSPSLRLQSVRLGAHPCAERTSKAPTTLPSSGEVVALNFAVGPGCPSDRSIDVRVTFAAGGSRLHADTLVSLSRVTFLECTPA